MTRVEKKPERATSRAEDLEIPMSLACVRLRLSRERGMRALFDGRLTGRQVHGRWVVALDSIERWERQYGAAKQ